MCAFACDVSAQSVTVTSSSNPSQRWEFVTFTAKVSGASPSGTVTFNVGSPEFVSGPAVTLVPLNASMSTATWIFRPTTSSLGNRTVTAFYSGNLGTASGNVTQNIVDTRAQSTSMSISTSPASPAIGQLVTFTTPITSPSLSPTGVVSYYAETGGELQLLGTAPATNVSTGTSTANFSTSALPFGTTKIWANYVGPNPFEADNISTLVTVGAPHSTTSVLTINPSSAVVGQTVTFKASITSSGGTPSGTVMFKIAGSDVGPVTLVSGNATTTLSFASTGVFAGNVTYAGGGGFLGSTSSVKFVSVSAASTTTSLQSSANPAYEGISVLFTATITPQFGGSPGGTVDFTYDGNPMCTGVAVSSGTAQCSFALPAGTSNVVASYSGTSSHGASSGGLFQDTLSRVDLLSNSNPSQVGEYVTFTANVHGTTPTGQVVFVIDGSPTTAIPVGAVNGNLSSASYVASALAFGNHTVVANYAGNLGNFSSGVLDQDVIDTRAFVTTITLAGAPNPAASGANVTFSANMSAAFTPTGVVNFYGESGGLLSLLASRNAIVTGSTTSKANFSTTALPNGVNSVYANFIADAPLRMSSNVSTVTVGLGSTNTSLSIAPNPALTGENVTFTATVTSAGGTPTGSVTFDIAGSSFGPIGLSNGTASYVTSFALAGNRTAKATYSPTGLFLASATANTSFTIVNSPTTTTSLSIVPNPANVGDTVTFTAQVNSSGGTPTGSVTFYIGPASFGPFALANGSASYATSFGVAGNVSANAVYAPTGLFQASSSGNSSVVILNPATFISIDDVSVTESNSGTKAMTFTVTRTGTPVAVTFNWGTANGTASAGSDYNAVAGGVATINAGGTGTKTITVTLLGDLLDEDDETLFVNLSNPSAGAILDGQGVGTILDNDNPPHLSVNSITTNPEATTTANFVITLNAPSSKTVTVNAQTSNVTATAGLDYTGVGSTVITFNPGEVSKPFPVNILDDSLDENNETFNVDLSGAVNATIQTSPGVGTITDNDPAPSLSINDVAVTEGNFGAVTANFSVSLSAPSEKVITFEYVTVDQTATSASGDYVAAGPTTLVFNPGDPLTKNIPITVNGDLGDEPNTETFKVVISTVTGIPANATFADNTGVGTITDDDATPSFSINDVSLTEGDAGTQNAVFTVTLSAPSGQTTSVKATTVSGTATTPSDYANPGAQTLTFLPGEVTKSYTVPVVGDVFNEATTETFTVNLSLESNATVSDATGVGTITDNDGLPLLAIADVSAVEGDSGTQTFTFNVTLSPASGRTVTVAAQTANNTATAPSDYVAKGPQTLSFAAGETLKTFTVTVKGDTVAEADESFFVNLSGEVNATYGDNQGAGTIVNNDPAISISDATVTEGGQLAFVVTRTAGTAAVTFDWAATDGTATVANNDYGPTVSGSGSIPAGSPGDTTTIYVDTVADTDIEGHETLTVTISNSTGAGIIDGVATGTIYNDDAVPAGALVISEFANWGLNYDYNDHFIEIANTTDLPITVGAPDLSGGFSLMYAASCSIGVIPDGTVIPARGRYLFTGYLYSGAVPGDASTNVPCQGWFPDGISFGLFSSTTNASAGTALDAVGFDSSYAYAPFIEGTLLEPHDTYPMTVWSYVRKHTGGIGGALQDTGDSANDWVLIDVGANSFGSAGNAVLGAPSPENTASETDRSQTDFPVSLVWPATGTNGAYNRQSPPTGPGPAGFELRRFVTNNTVAAVNSLRFKVTGISTLNSPITVTPTQAQVRVQTSTATGNITLPDTTSFNAAALTLEQPPTQSLGGGLDSTLRLNTGLPLAAGASQAVNFRLSTHAAGGYFYWVVVEAKP